MSVTFPDVPVAPGVPPVFRDAAVNPAVSGVAAPEALTEDAPIVVTAPKGWGIYTASHALALEPDSIFTLEPSREFRISDYPQEEGGFQTYNKVATPGEIRLTVTKGGDAAGRLDFLRKIEELVTTTDLFTIVTPDRAFVDYNFTRYDYRRTAETGAALLIVELTAIEVRQTAETAYTKTAEPSGTDPVNGGPVRPITPSDPVAAALDAEAKAAASQPFGVLF